MIADADVVAVPQRGRGADTLVLHMHSIGRPQVVDDVAGAGVDDDGVVAAHIGTGQDDVVVAETSDPGLGRAQRVTATRRLVQVSGGLPGRE